MRSLRTEVSYGKETVFIRAGIEEMSIIREWRSTLTNAVQRGYPIKEEWISSFRDQARKNNDSLDQRILTCAHSLAAMAAKGEFIMTDHFIEFAVKSP
jgi:hypothetical protein